MPTPNPKYDPDWETIHDRHSAERSRIGEEIQILVQRDDALYESGQDYDSEERAAISEKRQMLQTEWDKHHQAALESFKMQHPTIQEYAAWVFKTFDPAKNVPGAVAPAVNFEELKTLEDVSDAWSRVNEAVKDEAWNNQIEQSPKNLRSRSL